MEDIFDSELRVINKRDILEKKSCHLAVCAALHSPPRLPENQLPESKSQILHDFSTLS